jgi:branched-chain amino acid transport system ATP-binding protein
MRPGLSSRAGRHGAPGAEICRRGVGRTFQISRLFAEMTVMENLVASPTRWTTAQR